MENKDRGYPNYTALRISVVSLKSENKMQPCIGLNNNENLDRADIEKSSILWSLTIQVAKHTV